MNEGKIAGMNRLHGGLARVVHGVNPDASVSIVLYDECQAKISLRLNLSVKYLGKRKEPVTGCMEYVFQAGAEWQEFSNR